MENGNPDPSGHNQHDTRGHWDIVAIDSIDDPLLDPYRDLRHSKLTRRTEWFVAEGKRVVQRLLKSDYRVRSVLLSRSSMDSFGKLMIAAQDFRQNAQRQPGIPPESEPPQGSFSELSSFMPAGVKVLAVDHGLCSQLVGFDFHAGVMACADRKLAGDEQIAAWPDQVLLVCLPETSLPDNLGSILRLSASFSAQGVITGPRSVDPFSRRSVRVSMGNVFRLDMFQPPDLAAFLTHLKHQHRFEIVAGEQTGLAESLDQFVPPERTVLMLGNEDRGLGQEWLDHCDRAVQVEMSPHVDSLNVSTAAAILLHGIRQRLDRMPPANGPAGISNPGPAPPSRIG